MRRYTTFPDKARPLLSYLAKDGQILSGSLPVGTWRHACEMFRRFEAPHGEGIVHMTLSMPVGKKLSDDAWLMVARRVLTSSGLPAEQVPWLMWGREDTRCDHVHIVAARQTFTGRVLDVATSVRETDRIERDICLRLGLPEPAWRMDPSLVLAPDVPVRARRKSGQAAWLARDLNIGMSSARPTNLQELDHALDAYGSPWRMSLSGDRPGILVARNLLTGRGINPKLAGTAFSSRLILSRIALAARLRVIGVALLLRRVAEIIRQTPTLTILLKGTSDDQPSQRPRPDAPEAGQDPGGRAQASSSSPSPRHGTDGQHPRVRGAHDWIAGRGVRALG
jgi:hypothetical protein